MTHQERRRQITQRVGAGESITKVAADLGISRQRVSQIIHAEGLYIGRPRHTEQQRKALEPLRRMAEEGASIDEIAARSGRDRDAAYGALNRLGYTFPRPELPHGLSKYNAGCRCEECRVAHNRHIREWSNGAGKSRVRARLRDYREKNPERVRAWDALNNAVASGRLEKPERCACGRDARVQGHHDDYSRPLDVIWLCGVCHKARHQWLRQQKAA